MLSILFVKWISLVSTVVDSLHTTASSLERIYSVTLIIINYMYMQNVWDTCEEGKGEAMGDCTLVFDELILTWMVCIGELWYYCN